MTWIVWVAASTRPELPSVSGARSEDRIHEREDVHQAPIQDWPPDCQLAGQLNGAYSAAVAAKSVPGPYKTKSTGERIDDRLQGLVLTQVVATLLSVGLLIAAAVIRPPHLGPTALWPTLTIIILTVEMGLFLSCAGTMWGGDPDPDHPLRRNLLAIGSLLAMAASIVLGFTLLYWTAGHLVGMPAFYAAVGTLTAVRPPQWTTATGNNLQVAQELVDLLFLSGVVTIVLGLVVSRMASS
jgi:hypothetical protein